jgi:hypothetical protein
VETKISGGQTEMEETKSDMLDNWMKSVTTSLEQQAPNLCEEAKSEL